MKFNGYSATLKTLITNKTTTLTDFLPPNYTILSLRVYNKEAFPITNVTLGNTAGGNQYINVETIAAGTWWTIDVNNVYSVSSATSLYFTCTEVLTTAGVSITAKVEYSCLP